MKLTLALISLAVSTAAFAQQDLSSSNRDSTQNGVLSGTTTNSMREDRIQVPTQQPPAQGQQSQTTHLATEPASQTTHTATEPASQTTTTAPAGTSSGTTQAPPAHASGR